MPVYSMTGYANSVAQPPRADDGVPAPQATVSVELRSVNGRFLDFSLRMPDELRALEPQLRELVSAGFKRGKIEMRINTQRDDEGSWPQPQPEQLNRLANLESKVRSWLPQAAPLTVLEALNLCRSTGTALPGLDTATLVAARDCVKGLAEARAREGARLVNVLLERIARLRELAHEAEPLLPGMVARQQQRFLERWQEALNATGGAGSVPQEALQERAVNEAAAFAIRIDVAEELARLRAHLDELTRLLKKGGEIGKRLDFLIQELHREANTLGSKSAALELTNISVEMKVAIEQMREQVQNLE